MRVNFLTARPAEPGPLVLGLSFSSQLKWQCLGEASLGDSRSLGEERLPFKVQAFSTLPFWYYIYCAVVLFCWVFVFFPGPYSASGQWPCWPCSMPWSQCLAQCPRGHWIKSCWMNRPGIGLLLHCLVGFVRLWLTLVDSVCDVQMQLKKRYICMYPCSYYVSVCSSIHVSIIYVYHLYLSVGLCTYPSMYVSSIYLSTGVRDKLP